MSEAPTLPTASGYQPAAGEGILSIDVEVRPSFGFQTVGLTGRLTFPEPRSFSDALPAIEDLRASLEELAVAGVEDLVGKRAAHEGTATAQAAAAPAPAAAPVAAPQTPGQLPWRQGTKPNGNGVFRYLPSTYMGPDTFKAQAELQLVGLGLNPADVNVFDNRVGQYGLESGNESYSVGVIKAKKDSQLMAALAGKAIVGNVDFNDDGTVRASLSRDGKAALQALTIAAQLGGTPVAEDDVPF